MNVIRNGRFKKGVALVFALMTIVILFSIATTVTAVSISNGRTTKTVSYNDFALQAANWGVEAAIEYMGQKGDGRTSDKSQWQSDGHGGYWLTENGTGGYGKIHSLGDNVKVSVTRVNSNTLKKEYGLDYDTSKSLGADTWRAGDSKKIVFVNQNGDGRYILSGGGEKNDVTVEVICTEYRNANKQRPSSYELLSVAKVSSPSASGVSITDGPNTKGVLSTRVVCAMVRQEQVSDFMHFIQNARTFDAIDTALADDSTLREGLKAVVYLPQSYKESGRLRVDGYGNDNPEKNRLKKLLHDAKVDGTLGFFGDSAASKAGNDYYLTGDVTTQRTADTYVYKKSGANGSGSAWSTNYSTNAFQGALHTNIDPLGLPDNKNYYSNLKSSLNKETNGLTFYVAPDKPSNSNSYNNGFGCSDYKGITKKSGMSGKCPDVAQAVYKDENGKTQTSNKPTFATVRVEISTDSKGTKGKVRVVKYNSAMTDASAPGGMATKYVQSLGTYDIADIPQGTIYVEGGNVEVVNVKSFASSGLSTDYVVDENGNGINDDNGKNKVNHGLMGGLTIAANVNDAREVVRDSVGNDKYKGSATSPDDSDGTLYSDHARAFWESKYNADVAKLQPPYSNAQLHQVYKDLEAVANEMVVKTTHTETRWTGSGKNRHSYTVQVNDAPVKRGWNNLETKYYTGGQGDVNQSKTRTSTVTGKGGQDAYNHIIKDYSSNSLASDTGRKYWPTMTSSGVENEGNTFIGSDLTYGNDATAALGIVTKKSILLNDRSNYKRQLSIHGLFMCIDHSLQFDWRNKSGNPLHDQLYAKDTKTNSDKTKGRKIVLNGAIVGGFLDAEGDTFGRGYYTQSFKHDDNLLLNPPPNVPQWDITNKSLKNFAVLSYEDRGAINITE
ncbi:MAG: hypothetical protein K6A35_03905 [bacterium]|nr:hypothetical protein [bacterium]